MVCFLFSTQIRLYLVTQRISSWANGLFQRWRCRQTSTSLCKTTQVKLKKPINYNYVQSTLLIYILKMLGSVNVDTTAHMTVYLTILFLLLKYMTVGVHIQQSQGKQMITDCRTTLSHIREQRLCPLFPQLPYFNGRGNKINYDLIGKGRKSAA